MTVVMRVGKAASRDFGCEEARNAEAEAMTTFKPGFERLMASLKNSTLTSGANLKGEGSSSVYPAFRKSQAAATICSSSRKVDMVKVRLNRLTAASWRGLPGPSFQY